MPARNAAAASGAQQARLQQQKRAKAANKKRSAERQRGNSVEPVAMGGDARDRNSEALGRAAMQRKLSRKATKVDMGDALSAVKAAAASSPRDGRVDSMKMMLTFQHARVLMPNSHMMKRWEQVTVFLLLFTALVTPFEIAFLGTKFDALFVLNRLVDGGFLIDIGLNFRLAYLDT